MNSHLNENMLVVKKTNVPYKLRKQIDILEEILTLQNSILLVQNLDDVEEM